MRKTFPLSLYRTRRTALLATGFNKSQTPPILLSFVGQWPKDGRHFAYVRDDRTVSDVWFTGSFPLARAELPGSTPDGPPPDERTLKLGRTVSTLHDRLPTLLGSPLPQDILSPQISLHLFPSTHPHLPTVTGRIAYLAALWTAPVAWGRVPVVGNVKLIILSERMVKNGTSSSQHRPEKLIVRWKTCGKTKSDGPDSVDRGTSAGGNQIDKITEFLGGDAKDEEEFSGLFIFEFDEAGRIVSHTIEHAQQGGNWEKMTRFISVTDWLLGKAKWRKSEEPSYALGYCEDEQHDVRKRLQSRGRRHGT